MPVIDSLDYGEINVNGKTFYSDLVVWWEGRPQMIEKTHLHDVELYKRILTKKPDAVVIGVGLKGTAHVVPPLRQRLAAKGIRLFVDKTENAMEIYNALLCMRRKAVAVMHVTL